MAGLDQGVLPSYLEESLLLGLGIPVAGRCRLRELTADRSQFFGDMFAVGPNGLNGNAQLFADLAAGESLADQKKDLHLSVGLTATRSSLMPAVRLITEDSIFK
jgi:hypothetical protein